MLKISKLNKVRVAFLVLIVGALVLMALEGSAGGFVLIAASAILLVWIVRKHSTSARYICPKCGHQFRISAFIDFISPHRGYEKWVRCPKCAGADWCREI